MVHILHFICNKGCFTRGFGINATPDTVQNCTCGEKQVLTVSWTKTMNSCSNVDVLHNMPVVQTEKLSKSTDSSEIKAMKSCQVMYLVLNHL